MTTEKNTNETTTTKSSNNKEPFAIGDVVWAKVKGYPYWPAKIMEPVIEEHIKRNQKRNSSSPKQYYVSFFGVGLSVAWVNKNDVQPYDCEQKNDFIKKSKNLVKLATAIQEANAFVEDSSGETKSEVNKSTEEKPLLSIDEELELIKGGATNNKNTKKTKSPKNSKAPPKKSSSEAELQIKAENISSNEQSTPIRQSLIRKRNTRLSVQIDQLCTPNGKSATDLDEDTKPVLNDGVLKPKNEQLNGSQKTRSASKRSHSVDNEKELNGSVSDSTEAKVKKLNLSQKKSNEWISDLMNGIKNEKPKIEFESFALLIDFKSPLLKFIIETFLSFDVDLYILNKQSTNDVEIIEKYSKNNKNKKPIIIDNLEIILKKDVVFSFLDSENFISFEKELFNYPLNGVKFVNCSLKSYKDSIFYHHIFNDNNGFFIEAPLLVYNVDDIDIKIYVSSIDVTFFNSVKPILNLLSNNQIINKESNIGIPSLLVSLLQNAIMTSQNFINLASDYLETTVKTDETMKKYNKNDLFQDYIQVMSELFKKLVNN